MARFLDKLLAIASDSIVPSTPDLQSLIRKLQPWGRLGTDLAKLLAQRNGFWAYESALLVRPSTNASAPLGLFEWNDSKLWKYEYDIDLANVLFFAADVFGFQYCFFDDRVCHFDPEIGEFEDVATSLENWAECITSDFEFRTGYPLAHEWQLSHHPLMPGTRLFPKRPFVVGGEFAIDNLFAGDETERMKFCASLAKQIRDLPDGEQVKFDVR